MSKNRNVVAKVFSSAGSRQIVRRLVQALQVVLVAGGDEGSALRWRASCAGGALCDTWSVKELSLHAECSSAALLVQMRESSVPDDVGLAAWDGNRATGWTSGAGAAHPHSAWLQAEFADPVQVGCLRVLQGDCACSVIELARSPDGAAWHPVGAWAAVGREAELAVTPQTLAQYRLRCDRMGSRTVNVFVATLFADLGCTASVPGHSVWSRSAAPRSAAAVVDGDAATYWEAEEGEVPELNYLVPVDTSVACLATVNGEWCAGSTQSC